MKNLLIAATLMIGSPLLAVAQEAHKTKDELAIGQVIQHYIDAIRNNDAESLKQGFHPKAKWLNAGNQGRLWEISQERVAANLQSNARRHMPKMNASLNVVAIDITGSIATAKIEIEYLTKGPADVLPKLKYKGAKTTEYLSLIKFNEGWKIVSKVYAVEQIDTTAQVPDSLRK